MTGFAQLRNAIAQSGELSAAQYEPGAKGLVSSYDPKAYAVKLRLQPSDVETGWLPIKALQAGADFGVYAAPNLGDQMVIEFENGDAQVGMVSGSLPSKQDRPPEVAAGEILIKHKSGAFLRFAADGDIEFKTEGEIRSAGTWLHDGDFTDNSGSNSVTVKELRDAYNEHKHIGVQTGPGISGPTDTPAT